MSNFFWVENSNEFVSLMHIRHPDIQTNNDKQSKSNVCRVRAPRARYFNKMFPSILPVNQQIYSYKN